MMFNYLSFNLLMSIFGYFFFMKPCFFKMKTRIDLFLKYCFLMLESYLKCNYLLMSIFYQSLFLNLVVYNLLSLMSFIFSFTTMSCLCLLLGFIMWITFFSQNLFNNWVILLCYLVPSMCPWYLISIMILIETISLLIRPFTLSIRLMSNITTGHLLMMLISKFFIMSVFMVIMEFLINLIQVFVFSLLLSLYNDYL